MFPYSIFNIFKCFNADTTLLSSDYLYLLQVLLYYIKNKYSIKKSHCARRSNKNTLLHSDFFLVIRIISFLYDEEKSR